MQQRRALRWCRQGVGRLHEAGNAALLSCGVKGLRAIRGTRGLRGDDAPAEAAHLRHDKVYIDSSVQRNVPAQS